MYDLSWILTRPGCLECAPYGLRGAGWGSCLLCLGEDKGQDGSDPGRQQTPPYWHHGDEAFEYLGEYGSDNLGDQG
jgi:hypothetical protein